MQSKPIFLSKNNEKLTRFEYIVVNMLIMIAILLMLLILVNLAYAKGLIIPKNASQYIVTNTSYLDLAGFETLYYINSTNINVTKYVFGFDVGIPRELVNYAYEIRLHLEPDKTYYIVTSEDKTFLYMYIIFLVAYFGASAKEKLFTLLSIPMLYFGIFLPYSIMVFCDIAIIFWAVIRVIAD